MPRDSSGNYTLPSGNPVVGGTPILADGWANPTFNDLANEMTNSLDRQGRGGMLAPFRFIDGTEASPGMSWTSEPGTGFYRANAGDMRATVLSQDVAQFASAGLLDRRQVTAGPDTFGFFRVASSKHFQATDLTDVLVDHDGDDARLNSAGVPRVIAKPQGGEVQGAQFDINNAASSDPASLYFRNNEGGGRLYTDGDEVRMYHTDSSGGVQERVFRSVAGGAFEIDHGGVKRFESKSNGARVTGVNFEVAEGVAASHRAVVRNTVGGLSMAAFAVTGEGRLERTDANGAVLANYAIFTPGADAAFFYGNVEALRTANRSANDVGMGAQVTDGTGTYRPVGMNITPIYAITTDQSLRLDRVGHQYRCGAALTLTIDATTNNAPDGAVWIIANEANADVSLNASGGPVIVWMAGGSRITGNRTIANGSYVTVTKRADNAYQVVGNGLS